MEMKTYVKLDKGFDGITTLPFPLPCVHQTVLHLYDGFPLIHTDVLSDNSQEGLSTNLLSLVGFDGVGVGGTFLASSRLK